MRNPLRLKKRVPQVTTLDVTAKLTLLNSMLIVTASRAKKDLAENDLHAFLEETATQLLRLTRDRVAEFRAYSFCEITTGRRNPLEAFWDLDAPLLPVELVLAGALHHQDVPCYEDWAERSMLSPKEVMALIAGSAGKLADAVHSKYGVISDLLRSDAEPYEEAHPSAQAASQLEQTLRALFEGSERHPGGAAFKFFAPNQQRKFYARLEPWWLRVLRHRWIRYCWPDSWRPRHFGDGRPV